MTVLSKSKTKSPPKEGPASGRGKEDGMARGRVKRSDGRRRKSLVSLASEDDLLGRRMKGLTGGLSGEGGI